MDNIIASNIRILDLLPNYTDLSKFLFRMSNEHAAGVKHPCYGQKYTSGNQITNHGLHRLLKDLPWAFCAGKKEWRNIVLMLDL